MSQQQREEQQHQQHQQHQQNQQNQEQQQQQHQHQHQQRQHQHPQRQQKASCCRPFQEPEPRASKKQQLLVLLQQQQRHAPHHHQKHHQHHHSLRQPSRRLRLHMHMLARSRPSLAHKLQQMALPLSPLVQLTTGAVHPHFPQTVLHFWLLTDAQLESLARFYHQHHCTRGPWSAHYPCPVSWRSDLPLEEKRRRMGRFIGLRGCSPNANNAARPRHIGSIDAVVAQATAAAAAAAATAAMDTIPSEEEIARQARLAAAAAADDQIRQRKLNPW
ncbi:hypothetical protein CDD81_1855 [Ophiocordyceps australis]|uniref:Beta-xylosidase n=1 Tax=Ophiocordyceps australis TaxID=1399860 RepID=A0A2C5X7W7_9HYPO|nr:hypothetical protein CDD81_1855 [Ophiocordyceps australis]